MPDTICDHPPPYKAWYCSNRHTPMLSDATIDATFQYTICDTDILMPEVTLDDLRGYDGGEYSPQEERTAAFIENLNNKE